MRSESRMKREFIIEPQRAFSLQRTEGVRGWGTVCCSAPFRDSSRSSTSVDRTCKGPHSARAGELGSCSRAF